jgi:hypothetical protein
MDREQFATLVKDFATQPNDKQEKINNLIKEKKKTPSKKPVLKRHNALYDLAELLEKNTKQTTSSYFTFGKSSNDKPTGFVLGQPSNDKPPGFGFGQPSTDKSTDKTTSFSFDNSLNQTNPVKQNIVEHPDMTADNIKYFKNSFIKKMNDLSKNHTKTVISATIKDNEYTQYILRIKEENKTTDYQYFFHN